MGTRNMQNILKRFQISIARLFRTERRITSAVSITSAEHCFAVPFPAFAHKT